jgi:hypothetical protein
MSILWREDERKLAKEEKRRVPEDGKDVRTVAGAMEE